MKSTQLRRTGSAARLAPAWRRLASHTATLSLLCLVAGCGDNTGAGSVKAASAANAPSNGQPDVLATIGDDKLTMADVQERIGDQLEKMDAQYQQQRTKAIEDALNGLLRDKVLLAEAARTGKSVDELMMAEAPGGTFEPSPVEIAAWYDANKARTGGRTLEQLTPQISEFLRNKAKKEASDRLEARLNKDRKVVVYFSPYRAPLNNDGAPVYGNASSTITLTEFSDFECPFCSRFHPTLKRLQENYGKQIKIVYRQYPIPSLHPSALKAAEASLCAQDQGKFWEMHDRLFTDQTKLGISDMKQSARALGMDGGEFDKCLDSGKHTARVQSDMKEGQRAGVTGTPALFVNGVPIDGGAVPYETVVAAIEKEMARSKK